MGMKTEFDTNPHRVEGVQAGASPKSRNRNLIILRAGDSSLHGSWLNPVRGARNWDLHISYYGTRGGPVPIDGSNITWSQDNDTSKWAGIATALSRGMFALDDYEYIALLDDDIITTTGALNRAFDLAREHNLAACQMSLYQDSFYEFLCWLRHPFLTLHYTSHVELMAPILRVDIMKRVEPYFSLHNNLWAMDHIVGHIAGERPRSIAVLDEVSVLHTRAYRSGETYKVFGGIDPKEAERRFLEEHGFSRLERTVEGGLTKGRRFIRSPWWTKIAFLRARLIRRIRSLNPQLVRIANASNGHITVMRRMEGTSGLPIDYETATGIRRRGLISLF
jgi:hypothetical protein